MFCITNKRYTLDFWCPYKIGIVRIKYISISIWFETMLWDQTFVDKLLPELSFFIVGYDCNVALWKDAADYIVPWS